MAEKSFLANLFEGAPEAVSGMLDGYGGALIALGIIVASLYLDRNLPEKLSKDL